MMTGAKTSFLLLLFVVLTGCAATPTPSEEGADDPVQRKDDGKSHYDPEKVQNMEVGSLHTFTSDSTGFDTHSFFYDSGFEVIVFDAQFTEALALELLAEIKRTTRNPITHVVITHPNPDKFNGVGVFQREGAQVVASEATMAAIPGVHAYKKYYFVEVAQMFTDETYPVQASVDKTFESRHVLELSGGKRIELHVLEHGGVAATQTVVLVPELNALIVGDLVHHGVHAWLEGPIVEGVPQPNLEDWKSALDELLAFESGTIYGGRGKSANLEDAVAAQKSYLNEVQQITDTYLREHEGPVGQKQHDELAELIIAAFPDYGLPYMVQFSIYGLAQAYGQL